MIALNFGWSAAMNRIQTKTNLFRSFSPDARYLIGVSGGRDSVALLRWLVVLGSLKLILSLFVHHLLARSSHADSRFVKKSALQSCAAFQIASVNVLSLPLSKRMSIA